MEFKRIISINFTSGGRWEARVDLGSESTFLCFDKKPTAKEVNIAANNYIDIIEREGLKRAEDEIDKINIDINQLINRKELLEQQNGSRIE